MTKHVHDHILLYKQPKIDEGILLARCECGDVIGLNAQDVFDEAYEKNQLCLFDFNSDKSTMEARRHRKESLENA